MRCRVFEIKLLTVTSLLAVLIASYGCSGGNRIINNRNGELEKAEFISPDSIPKSYIPMEYRLDYGDELHVNFLYNEKYSQRNVKVRPDGKVSYPFVGEIYVRGKTVSEFDSLLTERFSDILKDPEIAVTNAVLRPLKVYVLGEVDNPGAYEATQCKNILESLSSGKGFTKKAKKNGVIVIRRIGPNHVIGIQVDVGKILDDNRYEFNIPTEPNDVILVPKSKIGKVQDFMAAVMDIVKDPLEVYRSLIFIRQTQAVYDYYILETESIE